MSIHPSNNYMLDMTTAELETLAASLRDTLSPGVTHLTATQRFFYSEELRDLDTLIADRKEAQGIMRGTPGNW